MSDKDSDPRDQGSSPRNQNHEPETNPFVAFRRFADEQVSSVLQSITGLPSSISPPNPDRWTIFTDDQSYKSMAYRQRQGDDSRGNDDSRDTSARENSAGGGASNSTSSGGADQHSSSSQNSCVSDDSHLSRSYQPYRDSSYDFPVLAFESFLNPSFLHIPGFVSDMFEGGIAHFNMWPLDYLLASPYSPLKLEKTQYHQRRLGPWFPRTSKQESDYPEPQWREAFEDLLRLENGLPMLDLDDPSVQAIKKREKNSRHWVEGLLHRGSMGPTWSLGGDMQDDKQSRHTPETEQDLYDLFLDDIKARTQSSLDSVASPLLQAILERNELFKHPRPSHRSEREFSNDGYEQGSEDTESWLDLVSGGNRKSVPETRSPLQSASTEDVESGPKSASRVVSTMTRTERVQQADGSIETKHVETKRYEDGREETNSYVETSHADSEPRSGTSQEPPKGGWFWRD